MTRLQIPGFQKAMFEETTIKKSNTPPLQRIKTKIVAQLFIIYTRYVIGGAFVFASLIKIKGRRFTTDSGEFNPINSAWHFFETMYQSGLYWKFIGICQALAGLLLLTQRYAKLGAVINMPIVLNIFIITLSYEFTFTPVITGLMLMANLVLLGWDWNQLRVLLNLKPIADEWDRLEKDVHWQILGLILFAFTFTYRLLIDQYDVAFWLTIFSSIALIGLILGLVREKGRKKGRKMITGIQMEK